MHVFLTGATGRLGRELAPRLETAGLRLTGMGSREVDVTDPEAVQRAVDAARPDVLLHAAAFTDVAGAETQREACWRVNVDRTRHVALAAREANARLIHVSSDYVFWGGNERPEGGYRETDVPGPVRNTYALTKLVAEEAARFAPDALIVRTSFREATWPHPTAFTDLYTSQDYVDVIADLLASVVLHHAQIEGGPLHVATERKSVYDLVTRRNPDVTPGSRRGAGVDLPEDVSLDVTRFNQLHAAWTTGKEATA